MKLHTTFTTLALAITLTPTTHAIPTGTQSSILPTPTTTKPSFCLATDIINPELRQAMRYTDLSAEKKALFLSTYRLAHQKVRDTVDKQQLQPHTWGVILDIDETVFNNLYYYRQCDAQFSDTNFPYWLDYAAKAKLTGLALPGAVEFTCSIQKMGGFVSLVSNRLGTITTNSIVTDAQTLRLQGLCFDQVVYSSASQPMADWGNKNPRFEAVQTGQYDKSKMIWTNTLPAHTVLAWVGDNIQDFPQLFQHAVQPLPATDPVWDKFGETYFLLPNAYYGSW
jgi:5'-nucleotidase (lipoprotein e(P4) family)